MTPLTHLVAPSERSIEQAGLFELPLRASRDAKQLDSQRGPGQRHEAPTPTDVPRTSHPVGKSIDAKRATPSVGTPLRGPSIASSFGETRSCVCASTSLPGASGAGRYPKPHAPERRAVHLKLAHGNDGFWRGPQLDPRGSTSLDPSGKTARKTQMVSMVGVTGFEPATYTSRT